MTNQVKARQPQESPNGGDDGLLSALWAQQAQSFPRLPAGAPPSIVKDTIDVKDPERVYRIYRASRRHQFQILVEAFVLQIRYGCCACNSASTPSCHCSTPTCFTYRRRVAGSKPIRRFNATSARTLAITLASKDNPKSSLCPHLSSSQDVAPNNHTQKKSKQTPGKLAGHNKVEALNHVLTQSGHTPLSALENSPRNQKQEGSAEGSELSTSDNTNKKQSSGALSDSVRRRGTSKPPIDIWVEEQEHVKLDPRSFVQNVFNTDAMRMLEWLTPRSIDGLTSKIKQALNVSAENVADRSDKKLSEKKSDVEESKASNAQAVEPAPACPLKPRQEPVSEESFPKNEEVTEKAEPLKSAIPPLNKHRRRSDLTATSPPGVKPYSSPVLPDLRRRDSSDLEKSKKLARVNSFSDDNNVQRRRSNEKRTKMNLSPSIKSITAFGHDVVLPRVGEFPVALPKVAVITPPEPTKKMDSMPQLEKPPVTEPAGDQSQANVERPQPETFPQSLGVFSEDSLEMLCTVLTADAPVDLYAKLLSVLFNPKELTTWAGGEADTLVRRRLPNSAPAWRAFAEQSIFYVLSDSRALLDSFTNKSGNLVSNTSLQQNFMRIMRVAPDVMLDALWIAAGDLYQTPADLAEIQASTKQGSSKPTALKPALERREAGHVIAILFNALIATLPIPPKDGNTENTYRERQNGHSYTHGKAGPLALEMDDALSNDLALRLARRLFTAISVRESFMALTLRNDLGVSVVDDGTSGLFRSLKVDITGHGTLSADTLATLVRVSNERTRIMGLGLRAWATKIFMEEWDGSPIFPKGGAIEGALSVLTALYVHRDWALEYSPPDAMVINFISDRLDASDIPVEWLSWNAKSRQDHLLNYPFLFPKDTLVTYFRAINFSRMSAAYDNAVGIYHRIQAVAQPSTLVTGDTRMNYLCEQLRVAMSRFMVLNIRRTSPLEDAFDQLWRREERELLRPLKIKLGEDGGELGSDSGGVQAEFFRLAIAEALNPDFGCFTVDERTKMGWFVPSSPEPKWKFELIGLLVGMAIYNGLTLPVTFPKAFYAKLLGKEVETWMDIQDGWPDLSHGFQTLLEWDEANGTVEDVFCRTYEFSIDVFGRQISRNLKHISERTKVVWPQFGSFDFWDNQAPTKAHSENVPMVTKENREDYVKDYIRFLTHFSVSQQLQHFHKGFLRIIDPKSLKLFTPEILQEVVEGVQEVSISELEKVVRYEGYTSQSQTIKDFWAVVRNYNQDERKKLLEFVTASDRVPVGGMAGITFVIQRNGQAEEGVSWGHADPSLPQAQRPRTSSRGSPNSEEDNTPHLDGEGAEETTAGAGVRASAGQRAEMHRAAAERPQEKEEKGKTARLPTAYTCYGTLLLPEYRDRETLRKKLGMALENANGFGFA